MFHASEIMNTDIVTVDADDTIDRAMSLMLQYRITGLVVVDAEQHLLGVLSDYDLIDIVYDVHVEGHKVADHMTRDVVHVEATASWTDVADLLRENKIRRLPVTHEEKLVGIITRHDLMQTIRNVRQRTRNLRAQPTA